MEVRKGGKEYFNKSYIKEHPEYLFVFEDTLDDEEFEKYPNVFPISTYDERGNYFKDKHLERNKRIIKDSLQDILKELKKRRYKRVVIPEKSIGKGKSKLYSKQPETYDYIKEKMKLFLKELEEDSSNNNYSKRYSHSKYGRDRYGRYLSNRERYKYDRDRYDRDRYDRDKYGRYRHKDRFRVGRNRYNRSRSLGSYSSRTRRRNYNRKATKKELRKQKKTKKKIKINSVPKASEYAQKRCNACIKFKSLLKKPLISEKRKGNKFVAKLEKAEKKCLQCHEICKYLDSNITEEMEDFDIIKARYPSICLVDEKGNKRVFRLMNSYREKLLSQIEHFDLNLKND